MRSLLVVFLFLLILFSLQPVQSSEVNKAPFKDRLELRYFPHTDDSIPMPGGGFETTIDYPDSAEVDSFILSAMDTYRIPGVAACVAKGGRIVWTGSYGHAIIEQDVPVADTTLFMLASISKTFTGAALLQLWEAGLFDLDDDINDYLPFT
ncbi:MAG: serine hydrolase domain-containing protein, partial [Candidatus Zixiibacteriota bacterium]